jgi:transposase-like protein
MGGRRFTKAEKQWAIEHYRTGGTTVTAAQELGCAARTVSNWLHIAGVEVDPNKKQRLRTASTEVRDQMELLFHRGLSAQQIAEQLGVTCGVVSGELKRRCCDLWSARNTSLARFGNDLAARQQITMQYAAGASMNSLAQDYNCSIGAIRKALETENVVIRGRASSHGILYQSHENETICLRSTWEVRFATWLDNNNRTWAYEVETFVLPSGHRYTPDFWIYTDPTKSEVQAIVDVKGFLRKEQAIIIEMFTKTYNDLPFEVWDEGRLRVEGVLDTPLPALPTVGRRCRTPKWKIDALVHAYLVEGLSIKDAGRRVELSESGAGHHLRRLKITRSSRASKSRKSGRGCEWLRQLAAFYRSGVSMNEIGRRLGVNSGTVHYHLQRMAAL